MKDWLKIIGGLFAFALVIMALSATFRIGGLSWERFAAPFAEETRTLTYESSRTYQQGMANDVAELCRQFKRETDPTFKAGIANQLLQRVDRYDWDKLPSQSRRCLEQIEADYALASPAG